MSVDKPYGLKTLPFPLSYETGDVQITEAFTLGNPERTTNPTWFALCLTNDEALLLTSALAAGADLIYPEKREAVFNLWERARQWPNAFSPGISCEVTMTEFRARIGTIFAWPDSVPPEGAVVCDGSVVCESAQPDLVADARNGNWVGYNNGGEQPCPGEDSYTLPDLRDRVVVGAGNEFSIGTSGGQKEVSLTAGQEPPHSHVISTQRYLNWDINPQAGGQVLPRAEAIPAHPVTDNTGNGDPHQNMPPYEVWVWCMWATPETSLPENAVANVFAEGCVIKQTDLAGNVKTILDVSICATDAVEEIIEEPTNQDEVMPVQSLDCVWGGARAVVEYAIAEINSILINIQAATELGQALIDIFPPVTATSIIKTVLQLTEEVGIPLLQAYIEDPDTVDNWTCELFCEIVKGADPLNPTSVPFNSWVDNLSGIEWFKIILRSAIGVAKMMRRFYLGTDECNNNWLLCSCVTATTVEVDSRNSNPVLLENLIPGAKYVVTWTGSVNWNTNLADAIDDGVYRNDGGAGSPVDIYFGRLQWDISGVFESIIPPTVQPSDQGYSAEFTAPNTFINFQYDDPTVDNLGEFELLVLPKV